MPNPDLQAMMLADSDYAVPVFDFFVSPGQGNSWYTGTGGSAAPSGTWRSQATGTGNGTKENPYTMAQFLNLVNNGTIVGPKSIACAPSIYNIDLTASGGALTSGGGSHQKPFKYTRTGATAFIDLWAAKQNPSTMVIEAAWGQVLMQWVKTGWNDEIISCNPGVHYKRFYGLRGHGNTTETQVGCGRFIVADGTGASASTGNHHIEVHGCDAMNTSHSGFVFNYSDYIRCIGCTGYQCGWSTISGDGSCFNMWSPYYNSNPSDTNYHNLFAWCSGAAAVDLVALTDGNGFIFDSPVAGAASRPVGYVNPFSLVTNCIMYMNGARGFQSLGTDNVHYAYCTSWKNGLELNPASRPEFIFIKTTDASGAQYNPVGIEVLNCLGVGHFGHPVWHIDNASVTIKGSFRWQGGSDVGAPGAGSTTYRNVDPLLVGQPYAVTGSATSLSGSSAGGANDDQWKFAPDPKTTAPFLALKPSASSPMVGGAIDLSAYANLQGKLPAGWSKYLAHDILGKTKVV